MILLIDNYDSFTYNLYQYLSELGARVVVRRNDAVTVPEIERRKPSGIVLSPGPGRPEDAGRLLEIAAAAGGRVPLLGVCLGHQALAQAFGGKVVAAPRLMHGKTSSVRHDGKGLYRGLPNPFTATRYHSLMVEESTLPRWFRVTARSEDGVVMGIRFERVPTCPRSPLARRSGRSAPGAAAPGRGRAEGVQFHPESVMTAEGKGLLRNFLEMTR